MIMKAVEESKKFPNPTIEYNFELPEDKNVKPDSFFGVKAVFNKNIPKATGYQVIYKY